MGTIIGTIIGAIIGAIIIGIPITIVAMLFIISKHKFKKEYEEPGCFFSLIGFTIGCFIGMLIGGALGIKIAAGSSMNNIIIDIMDSVKNNALNGMLIALPVAALTGAYIMTFIKEAYSDLWSLIRSVAAATWLPVVGYFATKPMLRSFLSSAWVLPSFLLGVSGICGLLWRSGKQREMAAQNPLHGILSNINVSMH